MTFDCLEFDREWVLNERTVAAQGGSAAGNVLSADDPVPIYRRGVWFNGAQYYSLTGLVLNHTFIMKIWTKVYSNGAIYSINREANTGGNGKDDYFLVSASATGVQFTYNGELKTDVLAEVGGLDLSSNYNHIALCNTYTANTSILISIYINGNPATLASTDQSEVFDLIADRTSFKHHIGVDFHTSTPLSWFSGFVWQICYYSGCTDELLNTTIGGPCGANRCENCPEELDETNCIVNCNWNEFFDEASNTCIPCNT
jgi:hypothetical protein